MPLGTLDRTPPPFFRQGPSALSKLTVFSALALFLMVADVRFSVTQPVRALIANALYPAQWIVMEPIGWVRSASGYVQSLQSAQQQEEQARKQLNVQSQRAGQVEQLTLENTRLRRLLDLRERIATPAQAAQVLYDAADAFSRKVVIDRGTANGVVAGSPVIDEAGVLGQVTRVYGSVSEVTLVTDRDQAIPILNTRTGARGVAFGDPAARAGGLELRYMGANSDVQAGDILATSGVDGVYPPGLPVARVDKVDRRSDSAFARIYLHPLALVGSTAHVMVLTPVGTQMAARPVPEVAVAPVGKKAVLK
jgi:rod shape-determining protein MreC